LGVRVAQHWPGFPLEISHENLGYHFCDGGGLNRGLALFGASPEERVIFDIDLTRGSAGSGAVTGGTWDRGWKCTAVKGERIVFDAGRPIANGRIEATFTATRSHGQVSEERKIILACTKTRASRRAGTTDICFTRTRET